MCAPVEANISPDRGLGLFAKEFIPKDNLLWKYEENVIEISEAKCKDDDEIRKFLDHAYGWKNFLCEIINDGKLFNHSSEGNVAFGEPGTEKEKNTYVIRDIEAGEELVDDYNSYGHPEWIVKYWEKYGSWDPSLTS